VQKLVICRAGLQSPYGLARHSVNEQVLCDLSLEQMLLTPLPQGDHDRKQPAPFDRQYIFMAGSTTRSGDNIQNAVRNKGAKPCRQHVFGNTEALLECAEAAGSDHRVANDQQRPPITDNVQRARDGAVVSFQACPPHLPTLLLLVSCGFVTPCALNTSFKRNRKQVAP
jgi:hypothetical protein